MGNSSDFLPGLGPSDGQKTGDVTSKYWIVSQFDTLASPVPPADGNFFYVDNVVKVPTSSPNNLWLQKVIANAYVEDGVTGGFTPCSYFKLTLKAPTLNNFIAIVEGQGIEMEFGSQPGIGVSAYYKDLQLNIKIDGNAQYKYDLFFQQAQSFPDGFSGTDQLRVLVMWYFEERKI